MLDLVRKFGVRHCDLPTMLWNVACLLRPLVLNIDPRNKTPIPWYFYVLTAVAGACYLYMYLVSVLWFIFIRCAETGDVLAALLVSALGTASMIGTAKLFYMYFYKDIVQQIVEKCLASNAMVVPGSRFSKSLLKTLRDVKKRAMLFWMVLIGNGVAYIMKPILLPGRRAMDDVFIIYGLEPMDESPNYEITFVLMAIGVSVAVYLPANISAFLIVISGYIEAQMLSWSEELLHLWEEAENDYSKHNTANSTNDSMLETADINAVCIKNKAVNEFVRRKLTNVIKGHATNIILVRQVEDVFRGAIAIEFILLIIGLIVELLGGLEKTYLQIPFLLMQVGMDCFTGQRLMDASMQFERAVYDCKWENFDKTNMKLVLVVLKNSQKTMTLSAGGITTLSFSSFMAIIKSIYSAYTTLRSTMSQTEIQQ